MKNIVSVIMLIACLALIILFFIISVFCVKNVRAEQTGTASWYSVKSLKVEGTYQKSKGVTANGDIFSDKDLTCAMWGVDFGSKLRVVNVNNGKSVTVTVNDRGPAKRLVEKGRIIDLSKEAFSRIANLKQGVISVKIEAVCQ